MSSSIKKNFFYSSILTLSGYIFPLITYPYVSRVLGVGNIGICNFVDSIVQYAIIISMMGISTIGIREVAAHKNDSKALSRTFSSLIVLNSITTAIAILTLILAAFLVEELSKYKELMYMGLGKLLFNYLLVEWFYKGIENFQYITKRSLMVKSLYVISVFLFVKQKSDYPIYFFLNVVVVVVNSIVNLYHSRKYVKFSINDISIKPFLPAFFTLGLYMILTSMYTSFNVTYLGFAAGEVQVGYYTTAVKLYNIIISIFTAFTGVMLPRMSALANSGNEQEFKRLASSSFQILMAISIPVIFFCELYANEIVYVLAGSGYEGAVMPMRIVLPLMLIIGLEQILVIQIMMPRKLDTYIFRNSAIGAAVGVTGNVLLVSQLESVGSALVWITSEMVVFTLSLFIVKRKTSISINFSDIINRIAMYLPFALLSMLLLRYTSNLLVLLSVGMLAVFITFLISELLVFRNSVLTGMYMNVLKKLSIKK